MWLLGKKLIKEKRLCEILFRKYYNNFVDYYSGLYKITRMKEFNNDSLAIMLMQFSLVKDIGEINEVIIKEKELLRQAKEEKEKNKIELQLQTHRQIMRIAKTIADGIAWRFFDFNRPILRLMAEENRYPSSVKMNDDSYNNTLKFAENLVIKNQSKIILNDITNFLRIGDITEFGKSITIYELKQSGKKIITPNTIKVKISKGGITNQERKMLQIDKAVNEQIIKIKDREIKIEETPIKFENNLKEIEKLIKLASRNGYSSKQFGGYLFVECQDLDKFMEKQDLKNFIKNSQHPTWNQKDLVFGFSNYDSFYEEEGDFLRQNTPYSIYPFSDGDCLKLISGKILLISKINVTAIKNMFIKKGFEITVNAQETTRGNTKTQELLENTNEHPFFIIKKGAYHSEIPLYWIIRIAQDFMKPEVLLNLEQHNYHSAKLEKPKEKEFLPFLVDETKVWN